MLFEWMECVISLPRPRLGRFRSEADINSGRWATRHLGRRPFNHPADRRRGNGGGSEASWFDLSPRLVTPEGMFHPSTHETFTFEGGRGVVPLNEVASVISRVA